MACVNRSIGWSVGIVSASRSWVSAHTRAGSARHVPATSRWTDARSQHRCGRNPRPIRARAVSLFHQTHRGCSSCSIAPNAPAMSCASNVVVRWSSAAIAAPEPGAIATASSDPVSSPQSRHVTRVSSHPGGPWRPSRIRSRRCDPDADQLLCLPSRSRLPVPNRPVRTRPRRTRFRHPAANR